MTLKDLYAKNRQLPNGGPRLDILAPNEWREHWTIGDGAYHYGEFRSNQAARAELRRAGFISHKMASENTIWWHTY